jgi:hypothetical protein
MQRRIVGPTLVCFCVIATAGRAQDFKLFDRTVQIHGFASQGFVYTSGNNWLTMTTNEHGSGGFTEMGLNMSSAVTDKLRIGAQVYDRNLGQLGQYHPELDWAIIDYRFKPWFGIRAGRVKTTLGLFTDTQDLDFLRTFALLPQGVYPLDLRDSNIAHYGGDIYGNIALGGRHRGSLSYTGYAGERKDSIYSGYEYFLQTVHNFTKNYGGLQYGGDLRWNTPVKGLTVGTSRLEEDLKGFGIRLGVPVHEWSITPDFTNQYYGEYVHGRLRFDVEAKRYYRHHFVRNGLFDDHLNVHAWYVAGTFRVTKRLSVGSFYSHYTMTSTFFHLSDTSLPAAHDFDKAVSARYDINRYWNVKVEGHFMDGYAYGPYPNGSYPQENPKYKPNTNALVLKTGVNF